MRPLPGIPTRVGQGEAADERLLPDFMIAGVGASAGGLEACSQLLEGLPSNAGLAVIVVQHLAPKHESFLPELLALHSKLPVVQVTQGKKVKPGQVYVIPPNAHLRIADGKLHLIARPVDRTQYMPIDSFFRSLAEYAQSRAIGIILSGTASDGAIGIREIKGAGGITLAQAPGTAKADGMPRAAIATGAVDLALPLAGIAAELVRIAGHPLNRFEKRKNEEEKLDGSDDGLPRIFAMLRRATGVDFSHYKQPTIQRRLRRRMVLHKLGALADYVRLLQGDPGEVMELYQDILIHVTRFFREPDSFAVLASKAFPAICKNRTAQTSIRIWVPGCATGEEAYSVAIALLEFLGGDDTSGTPIQIFGTDVSDTAIDQARKGAYPPSIEADVSPQRLRRFFLKTESGYRIHKNIRDLCVFARQDLTRDPPFSKLDLVLCRNVLIYLATPLQKRLMVVFHYSLKEGGFLMLSGAETIGTAVGFFSVVEKRFKLYAKKTVPGVANLDFFMGNQTASKRPDPPSGPPEPRTASIQSEVNQILLSRFSPPGVIVDDALQIVQFRGQTGKFLEPPPGDPSLSLLKMTREGLHYAVRSSIHDARKLGSPVRREGLRVRSGSGVLPVAVEVVPLQSVPGERHFLVLFEERERGGAREAPSGHSPKTTKTEKARKGGATAMPSKENKRVEALEKELAESREYMQSIIQDLEAANEELQSANEEILSANEELQSTNEELDTAKEELQSTNEELNTVNEELQERNGELSTVNSDLVNLLASVQIAIVIVTNELRIRRFTPMAERLLNLIPSDVGRPISDIKPNVACPDLERQISECIDTISIRESECRGQNGKRFSLRIRPYKNLDHKIDGAVIALFEASGAGDGVKAP